MLTPDTKATTYATGAVGTAANRITKGTITWGDRHTSCPSACPPCSSQHALTLRTNNPVPGPVLGTEDTSDDRWPGWLPGGSGSKVNLPQPNPKPGFLPHSHRSRRPTSSSQIAAETTPTAGCSAQLRPVSRQNHHSPAHSPAGHAASASAQVLRALASRWDARPRLCLLVGTPVSVNLMTLPPIPLLEGRRSRMLTSRTLAAHVMSRTTHVTQVSSPGWSAPGSGRGRGAGRHVYRTGPGSSAPPEGDRRWVCAGNGRTSAGKSKAYVSILASLLGP